MKGPITRSTLRTSAVLGTRLIVQASTLLVVARTLGPGDYGAFAGMAALAVVLGTLSTAGTHLVLLAEASRKPEVAPQVLRYAIPTTLLFGGLLLLGYLVAAHVLVRTTAIPIATLIALGASELLLQPLTTMSSMLHMAGDRVAYSQSIQVLPLVLRLIAALVIWLIGPEAPLTDYVALYFAATLVACLMAQTTIRSSWPRPRLWRLPNSSEFRNAVGYGVLSLTAAGPAELDKTLASSMLPRSSAGLYTAASRIIGAGTLPVIAMMLSATPRLFRESGTHHERTNHLLRLTLLLSAAFGAALACMLWFLSPLAEWAFGLRYTGLGSTLRWLCLAAPALAIRVAAGSILMSLGHPWMRASFELIGLATLFASVITLAPQWGIHGMAIALAASEWCMAILGNILIIATRRRATSSALPALDQ